MFKSFRGVGRRLTNLVFSKRILSKKLAKASYYELKKIPSGGVKAKELARDSPEASISTEI